MISRLENLDRRMYYPDTGDGSAGGGKSSNITRVSMQPKIGNELEHMIDAAAGTEYGIISSLQLYPTAARETQHQEPTSLGEALQIASLEAATQIDKQFSLATLTLGFAPLYRYVRSAELRGGLNRGGNSLLIGSGSTIQEVLALYMTPPKDEEIASFLNKMTTLEDIARQTAAIGSPQFTGYHVDLLPGNVTALEPNPIFDNERSNMLSRFPIEQEKISLLPNTIGEAIDNNLIPEELDTIVWNRLDPEIFGIEDATDIEDVLIEIKNVFIPLANKLRRDGTLFLSVGHGNTNEEYIGRLLFMKLLNKLLPHLGLTPNAELSGAFTTELLSHYFGGNFGMQAAIVAKKE